MKKVMESEALEKGMLGRTKEGGGVYGKWKEEGGTSEGVREAVKKRKKKSEEIYSVRGTGIEDG